MADLGRPLTGGNLNPAVVRVADTVRRTAGPSTPAVHGLLRHLAEVAYPAPRPLGFDDEGREVLTFIPGECAHPGLLHVLRSVAAMRRVGALIADYHRAQAGFVPPADAVWRSEGRDPTGSEEVLAHNDLAPWNLVLGPERWVFIDWDLVAPGRRMWDLAWALHSFVGLWPDAETPPEEIVCRIAAFCDGAEVERSDRPRLLGVAVERLGQHVDMLRAGARAGDTALLRLVEGGHAEVWERARQHVAANLDMWSDALLR